MKIIIFDFEVFLYDTLLGALIIENDDITLFQTWSIDEIKKFYLQNKESIWIGWNNEHYDNFILQACLKDNDPKKINDDIIIRDKRQYLNIHLHYYDIMSAAGFFSLKVTEALDGKQISESKVSFNLQRRLTNEEKEIVELYNFDDLEQTLDNFIKVKDAFILQLETIAEFKLDMKALSYTEAMTAEKVLHAERIDGISSWVVKPKHYDNLIIKNKEVLEFYLEEKFLSENAKLTTTICGVEHIIGVGGIHGARKIYKAKNALYFDVSGYYNLIMIKYGLLPRSIPDEYKKVYEEMYYEQLRLKKINPRKRNVLKTILLAVFGASLNEHLGFYDPYHGRLITMTGQIFLVDLLEKLEGKIELVQSNTDGIIVVPNEGISEQEIVEIVNEWQNRTGFNLKIEHISDIVQRDVNCYMYKQDDKIFALGGDIAHYTRRYIFPQSKDAFIIGDAIVNYFMLDKMPEETVFENKSDLKLFQYIAKKGTFKYVELQEDYEGYSNIEEVQSVNRVFASNDKIKRMLYKCNPEGKTKRSKVSNLPDNIFVYNNEILSNSVKDDLITKIDYQFYIDKIYDKIKTYVNIIKIKELKI